LGHTHRYEEDAYAPNEGRRIENERCMIDEYLSARIVAKARDERPKLCIFVLYHAFLQLTPIREK
jgi:hypothetical protein